ncbi:MAG TPA: HAMP domain-containing sensor histidine kinase [Polyangiaceae bacterium]|nr:HAMP domain-containing sensor histidine kinase [Polyangiaceae bacterium]
MVALSFVLAAAAFLGATFYADTRLGRVVRLTHDVSENAMPSLAEIGVMQRALGDVHFRLEQQAVGDEVDPALLDGSLRELQEARRKYESYPQFEGEEELWAPARRALDSLPLVIAQIRSDAQAGSSQLAQRRVDEVFAPAEAAVSSALAGVHRLNLEQGNVAARRADRAWRRARMVSFALDLACVLLTAGLAVLALKSVRRLLASEARRANELDAFAARVAHDIRGPLTPPMFALKRLAAELEAESPHRVMVERGIRGLQHAEALVADLLMFARAAATQDPEASASLGDVITGAVQDVESDASSARVQLEVGDLPVATVCCSPGVLASIVGNLVGNAIKYMPADAKTRVVSIRAHGNDGCVSVEVADTGAGVSEEQQRCIFEPYVRGDSSRAGLGLGLATAKRLVVAHGGNIGVRPRAGGGAVFWFELPCRSAAPLTQPVPRGPTTPRRAAGAA